MRPVIVLVMFVQGHIHPACRPGIVDRSISPFQPSYHIIMLVESNEAHFVSVQYMSVSTNKPQLKIEAWAFSLVVIYTGRDRHSRAWSLTVMLTQIMFNPTSAIKNKSCTYDPPNTESSSVQSVSSCSVFHQSAATRIILARMTDINLDIHSLS